MFCRKVHVSGFVLKNLRLASLVPGKIPYGLLDNASLVICDGLIAWLGQADELPNIYAGFQHIGCDDRLLTPALIDCHTHVVFAGNRAHEFELRLQGASYEEIARAGGGIVSTVKATRAASEDALLAQSLPRVDALLAEGVCTVEIKSGYGLDIETELRMLRVARRISENRNVQVKTSFLGAHAVPAEYANRSSAYIDDVCIPALRMANAEGLVDAVDGFCEGIGFSVLEMQRVFAVAKSLGLSVKLHAEQLSNLGGAKLAASYHALSADHLEYLDEEGVIAMKAGNCTAVILPGAYYTIREKQAPPIALLRKHGVAMAVSTDCNPGSSPMTSLLLAMNMSATLFRLTPEECLLGVTRHAAKALGLSDRGELAVGKRADLALWNVQHPNELTYRLGFNPLHQRYYGGELCAR